MWAQPHWTYGHDLRTLCLGDGAPSTCWPLSSSQPSRCWDPWPRPGPSSWGFSSQPIASPAVSWGSLGSVHPAIPVCLGRASGVSVDRSLENVVGLVGIFWDSPRQSDLQTHQGSLHLGSPRNGAAGCSRLVRPATTTWEGHGLTHSSAGPASSLQSPKKGQTLGSSMSSSSHTLPRAL